MFGTCLVSSKPTPGLWSIELGRRFSASCRAEALRGVRPGSNGLLGPAEPKSLGDKGPDRARGVDDAKARWIASSLSRPIRHRCAASNDWTLASHVPSDLQDDFAAPCPRSASHDGARYPKLDSCMRRASNCRLSPAETGETAESATGQNQTTTPVSWTVVRRR
ncbi:hypothetical protein L209DRAFT_18138 [Thermothelomyces heterothallicus CBS 203.75]